MNKHDDVELVAGDDWVIDCTLLDIDGAALDVSLVDLLWVLRGGEGQIVIQPDQVTVYRGLDPTLGLPTITVSSSLTASLAPGRYSDALRVLIGGKAETLWEGAIEVQGNRFGSVRLQSVARMTDVVSGMAADAVVV